MTIALMAVTLVLLAGLTFLNGFHDASNAVAAAVRTRALTPGLALIVISAFTFLGTFLSTGLSHALVARVDSLVPTGPRGLFLLIAAFLTAGAWGLWTWWRGQPSSSTHALLASVAGAALASTVMGLPVLHDAVGLLLGAVLLPLVVTSIVAPLLAFLICIPVVWFLRFSTPRRADAVGRGAQSISACAVGLAHGLQDGQRAVAFAAVTVATLGAAAPASSILAHNWFVELGAAALLAGGTLCGGWRITHTLSSRLVTLDPLRAGTANVVSAGLLFVGAYALHLPISSTHAVVSSLVGAGLQQRHSAVRWSTVRTILGYWLATPIVCVAGAFVLGLAASALPV